jgi:hypothetical protein
VGGNCVVVVDEPQATNVSVSSVAASRAHRRRATESSQRLLGWGA